MKIISTLKSLYNSNILIFLLALIAILLSIVVVSAFFWIGIPLLGGYFQDHGKVLVVKNGEKYWRTIEQAAQGQLTSDPVDYDTDYQLVGDMAMLSAIVYSGEKAPNNRPNYAEDTVEYAQVARKLKYRGWKIFPFTYRLTPPQKPRKLEMVNGLTYDVWVNENMGPSPLAVFVFRGTNKFSLSDWIANLHHLTNTPGKWDQYEQAVILTKDLMDKLDVAYGKKQRMFAAGHSLGGGLAQCARYYNPRISKTFAFNSSPITDSHNAPKQQRLNNYKKRPTYMIYESNEILAALRFVPRFIYRFKTGVNIVSVRYNFSEKHNSFFPVSQHSMEVLVGGLTK